MWAVVLCSVCKSIRLYLQQNIYIFLWKFSKNIPSLLGLEALDFVSVHKRFVSLKFGEWKPLLVSWMIRMPFIVDSQEEQMGSIKPQVSPGSSPSQQSSCLALGKLCSKPIRTWIVYKQNLIYLVSLNRIQPVASTTCFAVSWWKPTGQLKQYFILKESDVCGSACSCSLFVTVAIRSAKTAPEQFEMLWSIHSKWRLGFIPRWAYTKRKQKKRIGSVSQHVPVPCWSRNGLSPLGPERWASTSPDWGWAEWRRRGRRCGRRGCRGEEGFPTSTWPTSPSTRVRTAQRRA